MASMLAAMAKVGMVVGGVRSLVGRRALKGHHPHASLGALCPHMIVRPR